MRFGVEKTCSLLNAQYSAHQTSPCYHLIFAYALVFELLEAGQLAEAKSLHAFYGEVIPGYKNFFFSISKSFVTLNRRDQAIINLKKTLQLEPEHAEAKKLLGELKK